MGDFIQYEDFLPNVRESLYRKNPSDLKRSQSSHRKFKKVKFNPEPNNVSSPKSNSNLQEIKQNKLKTRKATPFKTKQKKSPIMRDEDDSYSQGSLNRKKAPTKKLKKKQVVISFSSSSDSFEEELEDYQLTPSKSEMETIQNTNNRTSKRKSFDRSNTNSEEEDCGNFDLDAFFKTRDMSELNESVTEPHSGINHEFVSDYAKDAKIIESEPMCTQEENVIDEISGEEDVGEVITEENGTEPSDDEDVLSVIEKVKESSISDKNYTEDGPTNHPQDQQIQDEDIPNDYCPAEYYDFEDRKLIVLKEDESIPCYGLFTLKVLHGQLEVLGSILNNTSDAVNLYSPRGSALLYIKNLTRSGNANINISKFIPTEDSLGSINYFVEANYAVFLCIRLEDPKIRFLEKYISQKIFPTLEEGNTVQVIFEPENLNPIVKSSDWDEILNSVNNNTRLMFAGGKGVGKSTLLRFAINKLLNKFDKVRVLDLDPGQSEFAVPGCVSIVTVTQPVFGPNFSHLKQPDRSLLSNINTGHDPRAYLNCVKSLGLYLESSPADCPILINYMGFAQGIGLNLIASAIKYIEPTNIIQICSKNHKKNFKDDLTFKVVEENCKLFSSGEATHLSHPKLSYKLHKVSAMNDENDKWVLEPRLSREMCVLAYFGQMMRNGVNSLTSEEVPMYEIELSEIKITNLQGQEIAPAVANANMVALCYLEQESHIFVCLGYGVIRGIDLEEDRLVLITPEEPDILEQVRYLVVGSVSLPPSIYMTPDVSGPIPYVMEGELVSLGQITKRSYLPVNKK